VCRGDILDQVPQEILDEVVIEPVEGDPNMRRHRDEGYDSEADETDPDATHIKLRYGAREIGFITNDGVDKEISYDDGTVSFRVVYKNRRFYLLRKDYPDHPVALNPLTAVCAAIPQVH
jgi:hypothetical protein